MHKSCRDRVSAPDSQGRRFSWQITPGDPRGRGAGACVFASSRSILCVRLRRKWRRLSVWRRPMHRSHRDLTFGAAKDKAFWSTIKKWTKWVVEWGDHLPHFIREPYRWKEKGNQMGFQGGGHLPHFIREPTTACRDAEVCAFVAIRSSKNDDTSKIGYSSGLFCPNYLIPEPPSKVVGRRKKSINPHGGFVERRNLII